jgi:hypothetical protein
MGQWIEAVIRHTGRVPEQIRLHEVRIQAHIEQNNLLAAVRTAL